MTTLSSLDIFPTSPSLKWYANILNSQHETKYISDIWNTQQNNAVKDSVLKIGERSEDSPGRNVSAKKSRHRRKMYGKQLYIRLAFLKMENKELKDELQSLKEELAVIVNNTNKSK